jgi:hypothetical protein
VIAALAVSGSLLILGALIGATVMWMVTDWRRWRQADARVDAEHEPILRRWRPATDMASRQRDRAGTPRPRHRRPWTLTAWPRSAPAPDRRVRGDVDLAAWDVRDVNDPQAVVRAIFNQATVRRAVGVATVERRDPWEFFDAANAVLRGKTPAVANGQDTGLIPRVVDEVPV